MQPSANRVVEELLRQGMPADGDREPLFRAFLEASFYLHVARSANGKETPLVTTSGDRVFLGICTSFEELHKAKVALPEGWEIAIASVSFLQACSLAAKAKWDAIRINPAGYGYEVSRTEIENALIGMI